MSTERKIVEPLSDARLQELIDELSRRYVRERGDDTYYDAVKALSELKGMRAGMSVKRGAA